MKPCAQHIFACIGLTATLAIAAAAQPADVPSGHRFFATATAGYSAFLLHSSDAKTHGHLGTAAGLGYSYAFNRHFAVRIGAEMELRGSSTAPHDITEQRQVADFEGDIATLTYTYIRCRERQQATFVAVPLSVEVAFGQWYVALGAKLGVPLSASSVATAQPLRITGTYADYIGVLENIPEGGFIAANIESKNSIRFAQNIAAIAEAGRTIIERRNAPVLRLALVADYSFSNLYVAPSDGTKPFASYSPTSITAVHLNTSAASPSVNRISALFVGLKITLIHELRRTSQHKCYCGLPGT